MDMFFDKESYRFRLKFLGREILKTRFGKIATLKFRPYVEAGRVFKEKESLTVWVTDDDNKIPLLIKADLAVGSLKATLTEFKGLQNSFKIIEYVSLGLQNSFFVYFHIQYNNVDVASKSCLGCCLLLYTFCCRGYK